MNTNLPIELRVRRDAMMFHLQYLIHAVKADPTRKPELDEATRQMTEINNAIDMRQKIAS